MIISYTLPVSKDHQQFTFTVSLISDHLKSESKRKTRHVLKFAINKKSEFSLYLHRTWWKRSPYKVIIFTKFDMDWRKFVDFLLGQLCLVFLTQILTTLNLQWNILSYSLNYLILILIGQIYDMFYQIQNWMIFFSPFSLLD